MSINLSCKHEKSNSDSNHLIKLKSKTPTTGRKTLPCFRKEIKSAPRTSHHSDISINEIFSPVHDLLPEVKSTILSGLVCFVDVRSESGDVLSKGVEAEVHPLGARIEKNFTKKVTHVIFKKGRVSTYLKAKKEGIPLVSVLWIEACKKIRGIADPSEYFPKKMDRYENILPFQTIKKRRLKFYNKNSKIRKYILQGFDDPTFIPTLNGKKLAARKSATVCKDKVIDLTKDD